MNRIKNFIKTTIIGGLLVVMPILLTFFLIRWIFNFVSGQISPLTKLVIGDSGIQKIFGDAISITIIILAFFSSD